MGKTGKHVRNNLIIRTGAMLLALIMAVAPSVQIIAANDTSAVKKANYVISNMSSARSNLESLARSQNIQALVYLKEFYTLREEADAYSRSVATVGTGQTVNIISVDADSGRNIWYKVRCNANNTTFEGYVEREFLASSDSRFLSWEDKYVTTTGREEVSSATDTSDIEAFPESYRDELYELKKKHPDWIFVKYNTNLEWDGSVRTEGSADRSLIYTKGTPGSYIEAKYGDGVWSYATDGIIAYYMDPRNFLNETQIFQFELLGYNSTYHTASAVSKITDGTFMSGNIEGTSTSYASNFVTLGAKYKLSPILQAARVYAEQGKNGSTLISGTYPGYENLYNYYNISASGRTQTEIIVNGLTYAREKGWTTRMAALDGGASFLSNGYISKGQDTYYFQKWNVSNSASGIYAHQYMQDITGAYKNANSAYSAYSKSGLLNGTPFVFRIPVYNKMPDQTQKKPDANDVMTINMDKVENLPVDQSAVIIPYINGAELDGYGYTYSSSNTKVATVDENGVITGVKPGNATISVKSNAGTCKCEVNVIKADIALADLDIPSVEVTYNPDQRLGDIELPDAYSWTDSGTVPVVKNEGYSVNYAPDDSKYNSITMTIEVTVNKAKIEEEELSLPEDLVAEVGSELNLIVLPENFMWNDANEVVAGRAGSYKYMASFCSDTDNYEVTENIGITVNVICSDHKWSEWSEPSNGKITRECSACDETEELEVKEKVEEKNCINDGHDMVDGICSRCGYEEPPVQEHIHDYTESSRTATCTEDGVIVYTCSCGDSYSEPESAKGHRMNGTKCANCGYELQPTAAVTPVPSTIAARPTPTVAPTRVVTPTPTAAPTITVAPTAAPTVTVAPTAAPTITVAPTAAPTKAVPQITSVVTPIPTQVAVPTAVPTKALPQITNIVTPTAAPTAVPSPTVAPTKALPQITNIVTQAVAPTVTPAPTAVVAQVTKIVEPTKQAAQAVAPTGKVVENSEPISETVAEPTKALAPAQIIEADKLPAANSEPARAVDNLAASPIEVPSVTESVADKVSAAIADKLELPLSSSGDEEAETSGETMPAAEEKIVIELVDTTTLSADNLEGLIGNSNSATVVVGEGITWDIDLTGVDISTINVDMKVTVGEADIPEQVVASLKSDDVVLMTLAHDGAFGFDAVLNVNIGTEHNGKYANLYYYNPDTDKLELVDSVLVTSEGIAAFNMKHASEYVISFSDKQQIAKTGSNVMLIAILIIIITGGIGVIVFVLSRTLINKSEVETYFDSEDNSLD